MGVQSTAEIDAWLGGGGLVVTASERAARALIAAFHRARHSQGLAAWPAPNILDFQAFVRTAWQQRALDDRLVLNFMQEQALWAEIVAAGGQTAALLEGPRRRIAGLAMDAHALLCSHAPQWLHPSARAGWQQDAAAFGGWLAVFDEACRTGNLLSLARLPLELIQTLGTEPGERPPLLLAGFDRILPTQRRLFDAWGNWREAPRDEPAAQIFFHEASDAQSELAACALWCGRKLAGDPQHRLLVVTQDLAKRRGEMERSFLQISPGEDGARASSPLFEFSLGIPLGQVALARGALLLLRWLDGPLEEHELDWLFSTGQLASGPEESLALTAYMRALRRRGLERTRWGLAEFLSQPVEKPLPAAWVGRMMRAKRRLKEFAGRPQNPRDWAGVLPRLFEASGWPGARPLTSAEYQSLRRWQQAVDDCASLGYDGRRMAWSDFLAALAGGLSETVFAPESRDAPIQIAGPAESAGLGADALWFLGADEDAWPASGGTNPLLPMEVQREAGMPHASPQRDWELASAMTSRLLASAPEVHFSFARQSEDVERRPSRLVAKLAGAAKKLPDAAPAQEPITVFFEDFSRVSFPPGKVEGGSSVLTAQSQCPFKAFASTRLAAQGWEPAEAGLTAWQRGQLLHSVLHAVWGGPPEGIRTFEELQKLSDRRSFVEGHVSRILKDQMPAGIRERMPRRYLLLEEERLVRVVTEWLEFEAIRHPFTVAGTEVDATPVLAGLKLKLRLDRIDRLNDNSLLVIDYKSGNVTPKSWDLPRPDDVQLPLYAGFALDRETEALSGLVFAKVRAGEPAFAGRVANAAATLLETLPRSSALVKIPFTAEMLLEWRAYIERLAEEFIAGRAEVNPRDYPKTCERCGLQTLCRIQESVNRPVTEDDADGEEADGE
jgi:probable DNA repair protein